MTRVCRTPAQVRAACAQAEAFVNQGHAVALSCRKLDTRTLEQNARLNAMCQDVSRAVVWHGQRLSKDDFLNRLSSIKNVEDLNPRPLLLSHPACSSVVSVI